jgi:hypothetical protein
VSGSVGGLDYRVSRGSGKVWTVTANPGTAGRYSRIDDGQFDRSDQRCGTGSGQICHSLPEETFTIAPRIVDGRSDERESGRDDGHEHANVKDVVYVVRFNETVTGVTAANFELTGTSAADSTVQSVTGSGKDWTVTVRGRRNGNGRAEDEGLDGGDGQR